LGGQLPSHMSQVLGQAFLEQEGVRFKTKGGLEFEIAAIYHYAGEG